VSRTIVFLHAHPDDEALLTGGTMARLAAEGHRVVLVTATLGEAGLADTRPGGALADIRRRELARAAAALGCARVEVLGFADSGSDRARPPVPGAFAATPLDEAADRLVRIAREEAADVLVGYDAAGGYGHPDHVQVHRVARRAAYLADVPVLLEATVDRRALQRALRVLSRLPGAPPDVAPSRFASAYTDPGAITHRIDVSRFLTQKRAAMQAHASQRGGGEAERSLALMLRLPRSVFWLAFHREWFVEPARRPARRPLRDVLAGTL
jgi:LmbE family N-acetylglucosaminyl deacetylase